MSIFVLDSNFFIQAHRATYPLDVATSFWNKVKKLADDELKKWIENNLPSDFFKTSQLSDILLNYTKIVRWAQLKSNFYLPKALNDFLEYENADSWLIAFTLSLNKDHILVTQEVSQPNRKSSIKIPDACNAFDVPFTNTIEMFRSLHETF